MPASRGIPLEAIDLDPGAPFDRRAWPGTLACVRTVVDEGLRLGPLTVLVGENGSGKSTLVEAVAQAYGMSPEGGSTGARHRTRATESELWRVLRLRRGIGASRWGFYLRAETMHGFYTYLEDNPSPRRNPRFHEMSHGESFIEVLAERFDGPGLYVLDEPESALSFTGQLALVSVLARIAGSGSAQAIVATHSPVVAATPGARILEVSDEGLVPRDWRELDLVANWSSFLDDPQLYLEPLLE